MNLGCTKTLDERSVSIASAWCAVCTSTFVPTDLKELESQLIRVAQRATGLLRCAQFDRQAANAAAQQDGYEIECEGGNLKVALVVWDRMDYHWYRQTENVDGDERWCHKAGRTRATNLDNSDNFITSPETCDRGNYTTWGGIYIAPAPRDKRFINY